MIRGLWAVLMMRSAATLAEEHFALPKHAAQKMGLLSAVGFSMPLHPVDDINPALPIIGNMP